MMSIPNGMLELEMKVLSCEGLNLITNSSSSSSSSSSLSSLLISNSKPIISLTRLPASLGDKHPNVFTSRLNMDDDDDDDDGAGEGGVFRVPLDSSFFSDAYSSLHLQLYTKRRIVGPSHLGWCVIPASDIGLLPPMSVRYLSYRLRGRDGCRGPAIINLSLQLKPASCGDANATAIGIPVKPIPTMAQGNVESGTSC